MNLDFFCARARCLSAGSTVLETYSSTTSRSRPRTREESIRGKLSMHGPETGIIALRDEIAYEPVNLDVVGILVFMFFETKLAGIDTFRCLAYRLQVLNKVG